MPNPRKVAFEALLRVERDGGYSNIVLNNALKKVQMDRNDTALAANLFYGVLERRITLDYIISKFSKNPINKLTPDILEILRMGAYQLIYTDRIPDAAAIDQSVKLTKATKFGYASGFVNGVLRSIARAGKNCLDTSSLSAHQKMSVEYSVPIFMVEMLDDQYGEQITKEYLSSCFNRPDLFLRTNTLKTTTEELAQELNGTVCENDYISINKISGIDSLEQYKDGLFHIQDMSSGLCCKALDPKPGERILDLCSAPGGKSFTMAQMMQNSGEIVALDLYEQKTKLISDGAKRLGISIIKTGVNDAEKPNSDLGTFDKILFDLPCSGLGILRRKPEIRYKNVSFLDFLPDLQYRIIRNNLPLLKKGGVAVFSTCTLNKNENRAVLDRVINDFDNIRPIEILPEISRVSDDDLCSLTLFPHIHGTDGFFISAFKKI